ncbi:MAG: CotH kinase family protein [Bacteroidales bacterium]|nr:CotH kinase family protein [Candidatus Liminaster caballi]
MKSTRIRQILASAFVLGAALCQPLMAQDVETDSVEVVEKPVFGRKHGIYASAMPVTVKPYVEGRTVYYTNDGSWPTMKSKVVTNGKVSIGKTCVLRAAEAINDTLLSAVTSATYVIPDNVTRQATSTDGTPLIPEGYPKNWGWNIDISGRAPAYYSMDRSIVNESKDQIIQGLKDLPIVSVSTDPHFLFGEELDSVNGGIYVYTGAPIGDHAGRDWERHISLEIIGGKLHHDVTLDCGIKIHGGHSRVPEKNAKHAFRLMFKGKYGPKKLEHAVYGDAGADKYEDLILRTHHSNSWLHWDESNRQRAQYTRELWARSIQERLGWPHSQGQPVHLFLNGLYWGMYNLSERITAEHCAYHYGGKKKDYDVIKVDELSGEMIEAADGTLDAWNEMTELISQVSATNSDAYYALLGLDPQGEPDPERTPLLDMDDFIDYMLINFYAGNNDWDHHNWFAFRRFDKHICGFRFICWDTELILGSEYDDVTSTKNAGKPSGFFHQLMKNPKFKARFNWRAHLLLADDGLLTPGKAVQVWDSLYHVVQNAVYDESARWGVYRRDFQPYMSRGNRYTVDTFFKNERNRLVNTYFPRRTDIVINQLRNRGWWSNTVGIESVADDIPSVAVTPVFDLQGRRCGLLSPDGRLPEHLPSGIYVVGGRKIVRQ